MGVNFNARHINLYLNVEVTPGACFKYTSVFEIYTQLKNCGVGQIILIQYKTM